jgi:hypothetical protein
MGSALQFPLSFAIIVGMIVGTIGESVLCTFSVLSSVPKKMKQ